LQPRVRSKKAFYLQTRAEINDDNPEHKNSEEWITDYIENS